MKKKQEDLRTKKRSDIRLMLGGWYYTWCRYIGWYTSKRQFASGHGSEDYPNVCFQHKSLLKRNLTKEEEVYQENKIVNLRLAVEKLDGIIVYPQETLSYWKTIGKPSASKGYKKGIMLKDGQLYTELAAGCASCPTCCSGLRYIHRYRLWSATVMGMMCSRMPIAHSPSAAGPPAFIPMVT